MKKVLFSLGVLGLFANADAMQPDQQGNTTNFSTVSNSNIIRDTFGPDSKLELIEQEIFSATNIKEINIPASVTELRYDSLINYH